MARYNDYYNDWAVIEYRLSKILKRDIKHEIVTKVISEFIDIFEDQKKELESWHNEFMV